MKRGNRGGREGGKVVLRGRQENGQRAWKM